MPERLPCAKSEVRTVTRPAPHRSLAQSRAVLLFTFLAHSLHRSTRAAQAGTARSLGFPKTDAHLHRAQDRALRTRPDQDSALAAPVAL